MKVSVEKMLVVLSLLALAASVSDGLLLNKCELRDQLNVTLPATMVNKVAKIVCRVELSTGFMSNVIKQITNPDAPRGHGGRQGRSVPGSSSEESTEDKMRKPKRGSQFTTPKLGTAPQRNVSSPGGGPHPRRARHSHNKMKNDNMLKPNTTAASNNNQTLSRNCSDKINNTNSKPSHPQKGRGGQGGRMGRSALESSSEESGESNIRTLYGLFQLPDDIACVSGTNPSLNICNLSCDSLINDDIRDDVACLVTIIGRALSVGRRRGKDEMLIQKFYADLFSKQCKSVMASEYFSNC